MISQTPEFSIHQNSVKSSNALPKVLSPSDKSQSPVQWAEQHKQEIEQLFEEFGCLLFRGFDLRNISDFEALASVFATQLHGSYGDLPKRQESGNIYHSTPYPEQDMILFHNESSHQYTWPTRQWFFCEIPSVEGGATPVVDCIEMARKLPSYIVEDFEKKGLIYIRNFTSNFDVSWQDFFKTINKNDVESFCRNNNTEYLWGDNNTLRIQTHCPGIITHPSTRTKSFFNQVQLHHHRCLDPELREGLLLITGGSDNMPRHVKFGDGSEIPDEYMDVIGKTYEACAVRFHWERHDVLMVDNLRSAHARDPFKGERKIAVALGNMMNWDNL